MYAFIVIKVTLLYHTNAVQGFQIDSHLHLNYKKSCVLQALENGQHYV